MSSPSLHTQPDWSAASEKLTQMHGEGSEDFHAASDIFKVPEGTDMGKVAALLVNQAPEGTDMGKVAALLVNQAHGPEEEIAAGHAPHIPIINLSPPFDRENTQAMSEALTGMSSITALYSHIWTVNMMRQRGRTEPYRITVTKEANQAIADVADSTWAAITLSLPGFYNIRSALNNKFTKNVKGTEIHLEFLKEISKGFTLSKPALTELDGVLTQFVKQVSSIQIEKDTAVNQKICQTIIVDQIFKVNSSGDDTNPVWIFVPTKRLIYLEVNEDSWSKTVKSGKSTSTEVGIDFNMEYKIVDAELNVEKYIENKEKFDIIFEKLTNANLQVFGNAVSTEPIRGVAPNA